MPPSGRQVEIARGHQRATIVEVGGGLRTYAVAGRGILEGYTEDEMCSGGRGQVLIPWPNRIEDGRYTHDGQEQQLALTEPVARNAIHGLVRWTAWTVADAATDRVVMEHVLYPQPGYPHTLSVRIEYRLTDDGLAVSTAATNIGSASCPFGSGTHPYLRVGDARVDDIRLRCPARTAVTADERGIPISRSPVDGTDLDLRHGRPIGPRRLDHAFTDLERDEQGIARVGMAAPDGTAVSLWVDESYGYLMLFTGDSLPGGGRSSLAVEPMTCAPNAFRSGDGLVVLEPGDTFSGSWGISPG